MLHWVAKWVWSFTSGHKPNVTDVGLYLMSTSSVEFSRNLPKVRDFGGFTGQVDIMLNLDLSPPPPNIVWQSQYS